MIMDELNKIINLDKKKIKDIVNRLGEKDLRPGSHLYARHNGKTILEAAKISANNYSNKAKNKPAIQLIEVVLAANRSYTKHVEKQIKALEENKPTLINFSDLEELINTETKEAFYSLWGHNNEKKYRLLKDLLQSIKLLKERYGHEYSDYDLMHRWAVDANLQTYEDDPIGKVSNIAEATFQHLRMSYGVDTAKPDRQVKNVLEREFGIKVSLIKTVSAIEHIGRVTEMGTILIDQIFVNYGSGYYQTDEVINIVEDIARKLKGLGVDLEIVSKATSLTVDQVKNL